MNLKNLSITIVTHVYATGPSFKLEDYLKSKVNRLVFIGHPFSFANDTKSFIRVYQNGKLIHERKFIKWSGPELFFYLKDLILTIFWCLLYNKKNDYFIGVNNFNAFSGYLLKLIGNIKEVIFYTIDYIPRRFKSDLLNSIYHWLDRFMVSKSYRVWNLSSIMADEREKRGVSIKYREKQIIVPIGTDINNIPKYINKVDRHRIVFMGHLREGQGVEMLISSMKDIVTLVPKANLLIVGGGPLETKLKLQTKRLKLGENIKFTGFVKSFSDVQKFLKGSAIAVAPYADDSKTYTRYTDPGKPKDYLACGLPVVITKVPQVAWEIERNKSGIAIDYKKEKLVEALVKLLKDDKLWITSRKNAIKMARKYEWRKIFSKALSKTI